MIGPGFGVLHQIPDAPVAAPAGFGDDHIGHHIPFAIFDGLGDDLLAPDVLAVAGEDIPAAAQTFGDGQAENQQAGQTKVVKTPSPAEGCPQRTGNARQS